MDKSKDEAGKPVYNLWYSQKQKDEAKAEGETPCFGKLNKNGEILEYTEARRVGDGAPHWDDAICLGIGNFHHRGEQ